MTTCLHRTGALLGPGLLLQTYRGIVNVRHNEKPDHDLFLWNDGEERRLSMKLDHGQNPDVKFEAQPQRERASATMASTASQTAFTRRSAPIVTPDCADSGRPGRACRRPSGARILTV